MAWRASRALLKVTAPLATPQAYLKQPKPPHHGAPEARRQHYDIRWCFVPLLYFLFDIMRWEPHRAVWGLMSLILVVLFHIYTGHLASEASRELPQSNTLESFSWYAPSDDYERQLNAHTWYCRLYCRIIPLAAAHAGMHSRRQVLDILFAWFSRKRKSWADFTLWYFKRWEKAPSRADNTTCDKIYFAGHYFRLSAYE